MIQKLKITNFRCFQEIELAHLRRFNVLVGPSGSGKTAFLEAIFLAGAGSAEVYLRMRKWRGLSGSFNFTGSKASYESLFREIFFGFDPKPGARIELADSEIGARKLEIGLKGEMEFSIMLREPIGSAFLVDPIIFRWKTSGHTTAESVIQIQDGQFKISGSADVYPVWLISPAAPDNYVQHYSELSKRGLTKDIDDVIRKLFPQVQGISIESAAGDFAIFVKLAGRKEEKIPIGMLSSGMNKFHSILTVIASNPNGVLLIDEIENGFYYENMNTILQSICDFAEVHKVQIIATTHSYELLNAFALAVGGREEDFSLLRSKQAQGGTVEISISRGEAAVSAIRQNLEVR
jgi:ABC-type lipoprotein export system ATPase subunit